MNRASSIARRFSRIGPAQNIRPFLVIAGEKINKDFYLPAITKNWPLADAFF
jgi:hypothetical protein